MVDVFVSYAREDEARVAALVRALQAHGLSVFWDRQIPPGKTWREHIGRALANARCVVVAWSRHSVGSDFVAEEADDARQRGTLVPAMIDAVLPPLGFRSVQAADLCDLGTAATPANIGSLLRAVDAVLGGSSAAARAADAPAQTRPAAQPTPPASTAPAAPAVVPPPAPRRARRWLLPTGLALGIAIAVALWLAGRSGPSVAPRSTGATGATDVRTGPTRPVPGAGVRIVDAWRTDDGGLQLRVQVQHRGPSPITVEAARAFTLVAAARSPLSPVESRPLFETLQPDEPATFELRFAPVEGARALRVQLPIGSPQELPLPRLR